MGGGCGVLTAVAQVAAVAWVQSLAQELLYAAKQTIQKSPAGGKNSLLLQTFLPPHQCPQSPGMVTAVGDIAL